jgi:CubicO group peptidase (beta-lactamase class C family)
MNRRAFLSLFGLGAVRPAFARNNTLPPLEPLLETTKTPGVAIAGLLDGKPFQLAGGIREAGGQDRVGIDTVFAAASLSKPVFAWGVRALVRDGKLDLDKPLQYYLDLGLADDARRITAAHVLTHSTGLPNWRFQPGLPLTAHFAPGTRWQYSGEGIVLLQRVVEKVAGLPIAALMKERVLAPMAMSASTFVWTPELQARAARGHNRLGEPFERTLAYYERQNYDVLTKAGTSGNAAMYDHIAAAYAKAGTPMLTVAMAPNMAGSLQTTAADYARFLQRVLVDTAAHPGDYKPRVEINRHIAWTLGWGVDRSLGKPAYFQWGDGPGFKNFAWVHPARRTALVFLTNGDRGAALYAWLFRQLLRDDPAAMYWI